MDDHIARKPVICAPNTDLGTWPIFFVRTEKAIYAANDLNSALVEWKARSTTNYAQNAEDESTVLEVSSLGSAELQRSFT